MSYIVEEENFYDATMEEYYSRQEDMTYPIAVATKTDEDNIYFRQDM